MARWLLVNTAECSASDDPLYVPNDSRTKFLTFPARLHLLDVLRLFPLVPVQIRILLLEYLLLPFSHLIQDDLKSFHVDHAALVDVALYMKN